MFRTAQDDRGAPYTWAARATGVQIDSIAVSEEPTYDEGTNIALAATATASSTYPGHSVSGVNDGVVEGYPQNTKYEWASNGQGAGA
jgi:hypothetical protein